MMETVKLKLASSIFLCFAFSFPELFAQNNEPDEKYIDIPVTAKSIFGPIIHRDMLEAYHHGDKTYIRIYMTVFDDKGGYPKRKDIWQDREGNIVIFPAGDRLWVGFGSPRRQLEFAYKYRNQGRATATGNNPLIRSFLVDSKVVIPIMENAVSERFIANGLDINVDKSKSPNQFGLREQSTELLRQNALSGSLVTYYMDQQSLMNDNKDSWGIVKPIENLRERLAYPDPDEPLYDSQKTDYPSYLSDKDRGTLVALKDLYDTYLMNPSDNDMDRKLNEFYNEYVKRGGSNDFHDFYKIIVPSWATQAELQNAIGEEWDKDVYPENSLEYFRQKVVNIEQDPVSQKGDIAELEQRTQLHKKHLEARKNLVVFFEEVYSFLEIELDGNIDQMKKDFVSLWNSPEWKAFAVGSDVSVECLDFFKKELRQRLKQIKKACSNPKRVTEAKKARVSKQVDNFIQSFKEGSKHEERFVITIGGKPDLQNIDKTYKQYHIDNLNDNLHSPCVVAKTAVIYFVESVSAEEASTSTIVSKSKLTPESISKFLKRNFICKEIDEIHVQSLGLAQSEEIYLFLSSLATCLRQKGEGYDERMVEVNQCYAHNSNDEKIILFPELHYLWSKDKQGTLLLFDNGKYQAHGVPVDNIEDLFPNLRVDIKDRVNSLKAQQFSGAEIIATLLSKSDRITIANIETNARKSAIKEQSKRKSQEGKDMSLKDAAKDEMNHLVEQTLCQSSSRRKRAICKFSETDVELVDESVEVMGDTIKFKVYEKKNPARIHEIINNVPPSMKALTERQNNVMSKIHLGLGVHGALVNFLGALNYFQAGDNARGGFSNFQSLHSLGQMSGLNERIATKIAESTAGRVVNKLLLQTSKKLSSVLFKGDQLVEKAALKIELIMKSIPITGIAFDIYFIEEDISNLAKNKDKELLPLNAIDLALDSVTSVLSLIPSLEPVVLALSLVRMTLDDIYLDILEEWKKVKGKGVLQHLLHVIIGCIEGLGDFITLGLARQMRQLELQEETYREFLKNLSKIENYFQVSEEENGFQQLDLDAGEDYIYGGLVTVSLFDNSTFEIEIMDVPTISGSTILKKSFSGNIKDVILGIGKSLDLLNYGMTSARLLIFPVKGYHTFEFKPIPSSSFGQYFGNRYNNTFAAIRGIHLRTQDNQCQDTVVPSDISLQLHNVSYFISGKDGNDVFILGPETFHINGGQGHDSYFIPWYGGLTVIDNFADDAALDSLFLNVSYDAVQCVRYNDDLHVNYCGKRTAVVQHWFASTTRTFHQHLRIITNDGVTLEPFENDAGENNVDCYPTEIDLSHKSESNVVDLSLLNFKHVATVVGSNFTDIITGNNKGNVLNGGFGADTLTGGEGEDVYVISSGEGCDVVNITSQDGSTERILFNAVHKNIEVKQISSSKVEVIDVTDRLKTCFSIVDENKFQNQQTLSIITMDNVIFEIKYNDESGLIENVPMILDFSLSKENVVINLLVPYSGKIQMSVRNSARVITIIDSMHSDSIVANNEENFLSCSGGELDHLEGMGGSDLYVIQKGCSAVNILNSDPAEKLDRLLVKLEYNSLILDTTSEDSLVIRSREEGIRIVLLNWFLSSTYQHLVVETEDGITCSVPTSKDQFRKNMNLLPIEMRFTEQSCKSVSQTSLDLNKNPWKNVQKVVARPKSCIFSVIGNALGNYIDLGPTSVAERRYTAGGNGSDTYVVEYGYGAFNEISNFANDEKTDHILLGILYYELEIGVVGKDMIITSSSHPEYVSVRILDFMSGRPYQHLMAKTSDGVTMKLEPLFPYKTVLIVDKSYSAYSVTVDNTHSELMTARKIAGSMLEKNNIKGGDGTVYIAGGDNNDTLHGGVSGNTLVGLGGSDQIYGQDGNDVLIGGRGDDLLNGGEGHDTFVGGDGADLIYGGAGSNTIVFQGDGFNQRGVFVDLRTGKGSDADADGDSYKDIQNIYGSEYNDILHGNDQDNVIKGFQGNDYIQPYGSNDIMIGGPGIDVYNCSDATGRKEIWLDGDLDFPDLIVLDKIKMRDMCFFIIAYNLFITNNSSEATDHLVINIMNFTAEKALTNFNLQIESYLISSSVFSAGSVDDDIRRFKRSSWMYVLDFSETEIIILLNGSFLQQSFGNGVQLRLRSSYVNNNMVSVTDINTRPYNRSNLILLNNLLPAVEYTVTLSLVKCHIDLEYTSVKQYTLPLPPRNVRASNILSYSFKVTWILPTILTKGYTFEGYVYSTDKTYTFVATIKKPFVVLKSLSPHTYYEVRVRTVVSTYSSAYSAPLHVRTNATCDNVRAPKDGYVSNMVQTEKGYVVTMSCNEGFELNGDETVICDSHTTVGNQICSQKRCRIPDFFTSFAVSKWYQTAPWSVWEVTWHCNATFEIDPWKTSYTLICDKGMWNGSFLHCIKSVRCPDPVAPENGEIHVPKSMSTPFKKSNSVRVSCSRGFALVGATEIVCLGSSWTELPKCIQVFCPLPPHVNHGFYQYISGTSEAKLACDMYHIPEEWGSARIIEYLKKNALDAEHIVCDEGKWISKIQNCVPIAQVVNKVDHVFHVRGDVQLMPKISWEALDRDLTKNLLNDICDSLGLTYAEFIDNTITCNRPVNLKGEIPYEGIPTVWVDHIWQEVCFYKHHHAVAEEFCQHMSYSDFTVEIYKGISFKVTYRILQTVDYSDPILRKIYESCDTYIRCRSKCSHLYIPNAMDCREMYEVGKVWWFENEECIVGCHSGYVRFGSDQIFCKSDGSWSDNPKCVETATDMKVAYEGYDVTFSCSEFQFVNILSANYHGRCEESYMMIPFVQFIYYNLLQQCGTACDFNDVTVKASMHCSRMTECSIPAANEVFGDPCPLIKKMLEVKATCTN